MSTGKTIEVVLVDDHNMFRLALGEMLDRQPDMSVMASFANGNELLAWESNHCFDILILDVNLPDYHGVQLLQEYQKRFRVQKTIFVTMFQKEDVDITGLDLSHVVLMGKDQDPAMLLKKIREMNQEDSGNGLSETGKPILLSEREKEILEHYRSGISVSRIARLLGLSKSTVGTHLQHIRDKLGAGSNEALRYK